MPSKIAIVTGAARGIGLATAKLLLSQGCGVALIDREGEVLMEAARGLNNAFPIVADVSDPIAVEAFVAQTLAHFGRIDHLVNNAGVAEFGPMANMSFENWRKVMATNLDGVFLCSQAALPALKQSRGSIVNIGSISGLRASTLRVAYGTSKAAVIHLSKQQAAELGEFGVRVNCIAPGPVRTAMSVVVHSPEIIKAYHDAIPLNRYGSEQEIAEAIAFLCSDKASYITGQVLAVDGGFDATGVGLPALRGETG